MTASIRVRAGLFLVIVAALLFAALQYWRVYGRAGSSDATRRVPSVYCEFYDFMRASVVVSFDFAVDETAGASRFAEQMETKQGERTTFAAADRPAWSYGRDDDTPQLVSPDGTIRILLYGLKPGAGGVLWTDAGLRSVEFRNLEGKCRQVDLGALTAPAKEGHAP